VGKGMIKIVEMDFYLQLKKKASRGSETSMEYQTVPLRNKKALEILEWYTCFLILNLAATKGHKSSRKSLNNSSKLRISWLKKAMVRKFEVRF
jgi:hypothetical protein